MKAALELIRRGVDEILTEEDLAPVSRVKTIAYQGWFRSHCT